MQFSVQITAGFLRRSHGRRLFRHPWRLVLAVVLVGLSVGMDLRDGHLENWSVLCLSAVAFGVLIFAIGWHRQSKVIDDWCQKQGDAPVVYSLTESEIEAVSQMGSMRLKWDAFSHLKISEWDTLLHFGRGSALTLPTAQVPAEAMNFMKQQFVSHDKKVEDARCHP